MIKWLKSLFEPRPEPVCAVCKYCNKDIRSFVPSDLDWECRHPRQKVSDNLTGAKQCWKLNLGGNCHLFEPQNVSQPTSGNEA